MLWSPHLELSYPFENQANDYSGNARHGTVNGSGVYATKPNGGRCLYFDGTGDYVATPSFGLSGTVVWFAADVRCKNYASAFQAFAGETPNNTSGFICVARPTASSNLAYYYAYTTNRSFVAATNFFSGYEDAWVHVITVADYPNAKCYFYRDGKLFSTADMSAGSPVFPTTVQTKYIGSLTTTSYLLQAGYLANVKLGTLATCPPVAALTANANRLMLGLNPIWSV